MIEASSERASTPFTSLLPMKVPGLPAGITSIAAGVVASRSPWRPASASGRGAPTNPGNSGSARTPMFTPRRRLSGISSVTLIAAGANHSLAITSDGSVWAWGANNYGQIGQGTTFTTYVTPMHVVTVRRRARWATASRSPAAVAIPSCWTAPEASGRWDRTRRDRSETARPRRASPP